MTPPDQPAPEATLPTEAAEQIIRAVQKRFGDGFGIGVTLKHEIRVHVASATAALREENAALIAKDNVPLIEQIQRVYSKMGWERWTGPGANSSGTYWHWNGDEDDAPVILLVGYCHGTGKCFVQTGQLGIEHPYYCDEYGGWWMTIYDPIIPMEKQREAEQEARMDKEMEKLLSKHARDGRAQG